VCRETAILRLRFCAVDFAASFILVFFLLIFFPICFDQCLYVSAVVWIGSEII
jgi:hypothetical protein